VAKSAVDRALSDWEKGLRRFGKKLIRRAKGKTCGTCCFYVRGGLCVEKDVEVHYEDAVACKFHEEKET
jgi:hypothetical protein